MANRAAPGIALLAPVPLRHLESGGPVCADQGRVAFGSRAWEVFRRLDGLRGDQPVDAYIYASHADHVEPFASWVGQYVGHVESRHGAHPSGTILRPPSTADWDGDLEGHWAVYWEVADLRPLDAADRIRFSNLRGLGKTRYFQKTFVPEGPIIIEHPA